MTIFISFITLLIIFFGYRIYVYKRVDVGEKVNFSGAGKFAGTDILWIIDAVVCKIDKDGSYHVQYARVTKPDDVKTSFYLDAPQSESDWNDKWLGSCGVPGTSGDAFTILSKKIILKRNEFKKGWIYGNPHYDNTKHQKIIEKTFFGF